METAHFFARPPKAERAFVSAYGSKALHGQFGIRIEFEPLLFVDPQFDDELEPEMLLSYLSLPSTDPAKLEKTRLTPAADVNSKYEGSFYFLGEHNWVDLKEIRFLNAVGNSIAAEYDVVIHLPKGPPNEYAITLRVQTEIERGEPQLSSPRTVDLLGILVESEKDCWEGEVTYHGQHVEITISADKASFEELAAFARSVISDDSLPRSRIHEEISQGLGILSQKLKRHNVSPDLKPDEFIPRTIYICKRRHHKHPETILGLEHPSVNGHWSLTFRDMENGYLEWIPP